MLGIIGLSWFLLIGHLSTRETAVLSGKESNITSYWGRVDSVIILMKSLCFTVSLSSLPVIWDNQPFKPCDICCFPNYFNFDFLISLSNLLITVISQLTFNFFSLWFTVFLKFLVGFSDLKLFIFGLSCNYFSVILHYSIMNWIKVYSIVLEVIGSWASFSVILS